MVKIKSYCMAVQCKLMIKLCEGVVASLIQHRAVCSKTERSKFVAMKDLVSHNADAHTCEIVV